MLNSDLSGILSNNIVGAGALDGPKRFLTSMGKNLYIPMGLNIIGASNPNFISGRRGRRPLQQLIDKSQFEEKPGLQKIGTFDKITGKNLLMNNRSIYAALSFDFFDLHGADY